MADKDDKNINNQDTDKDTDGKQGEPETIVAPGNGEQDKGPIPYDRFKAVNDQLAQLKEMVAQYDNDKAKRAKAEKEADEKRLAEQAQFEELAEKRRLELETVTGEIETSKATIAAQTAVLQALYDSRKGAVPEMYQPLLEIE